MKNYILRITNKIRYRLRFPDCNISAASFISKDSRLSERVVVNSGVSVIKSTLGNSTQIKSECSLNEVVTENQVILYENSSLSSTEIGCCTYIASGAKIGWTKIGKFCSIGPDLISGYGDHPVNWMSTSPIFFSTFMQCGISFANQNHFDELNPITIGNDVWIGARVFIRNGVKIGNGSIIAAGAVVVSDIPEYAIAAGVPAKVIRYRFSPDDICRLNEIQWWNWSEEKLRRLQPYFLTDDISTLINESKKLK